MNTIRVYAVLVLSLAGTLFSGYLSAVKFFTQGCVLTVPCPLFIGQPACYYGFAMFLIMTALAFFWAVGKPLRPWVIGFSALGALFATYFTAAEWSAVVSFLSDPSLRGIPSCAFGLIIYILVLFFSLFEIQPESSEHA